MFALVVQVHYHADIQQLLEYVVHKTLKRCRRIGEAIVYYHELVRSVSGTKFCLPFTALRNSDEVVGPAQVKFGEDMRDAQTIEVGNEGYGVRILLRNAIETAVFHGEA
jgi:hypothetical protein